MLIKIARKLECLENLFPKKFRLPLRYYGQGILGMLEPEMKYLNGLVDPLRVAIDIGANKGVYTYKLAKYAKHVYCFEPISELCDYIKEFKASNITVINAALSDEYGKSDFRIPIEGRRHVTTRASLIFSGEGESRNIDVTTLDSYGYSEVGFMKIDVEGVEEKVIVGGINTIKSNNPILLIEMSWDNGNSKRCHDIFDFLVGISYRPIVIEKSRISYCSSSIFTFHIFTKNIIFVPHGHDFLDHI